jgi:hypothetical protein
MVSWMGATLVFTTERSILGATTDCAQATLIAPKTSNDTRNIEFNILFPLLDNIPISLSLPSGRRNSLKAYFSQLVSDAKIRKPLAGIACLQPLFS